MDSYTPLVKKLLTEAGCSLFRSGKGDHDILVQPPHETPFSSGPCIRSRHTANGVLKQAGLPKAF